MRFPTINVKNKSRQMTEVFKGYDANLRIEEGAFSQMENMTSDLYPVLSPRAARGLYAEPKNCTGMIAKDALCYVDGTDFVINECHIPMGLSDEPKQMVSMGAYVIILPDRKYINTQNLEDCGTIDNKKTVSGAAFSLCRPDSSAYSVRFRQDTAPDPEIDELKSGDLWLDKSTSPHSLKVWSEATGMWSSVGTVYVRIAAEGIQEGFSQYDGVTLSWKDGEELTDTNGKGVEESLAGQLRELAASAVIWDIGEGYLTVVGILDEEITVANELTVERKMPRMDFVIESENRLWGCRYGVAEGGEVVNELYASKLGDFKNWNCFMGLSTDSYAVSLGTDGQFTGAIAHRGYPIFFKENYYHKVYGAMPSAFQVETNACRGVQKGCHKSLAVVGEDLYYKARTGFCVFDGATPVEVSYALGSAAYSEAVAGALGNKYYASVKDAAGLCHLFVYDSQKGLWHREDDLPVQEFCACRGDLYGLSHGKVLSMTGKTGEAAEESVAWMVVTGPIGLDSPDMKYLSRLTLRLHMEEGADICISAQYDFRDTWETLFTFRSDRLRSVTIPVRPRRCDHMRLKIEGQGVVRIYSICKTVGGGSEER